MNSKPKPPPDPNLTHTVLEKNSDKEPNIIEIPDTFPIDVQPKYEECFAIASAGSAYVIKSRFDGRKHRHGMDEERAFGNSIESRGAEFATAVVTDKVWRMIVDTFRSADVGQEEEVRMRMDHGKELIIYGTDFDESRIDFRFWLVTGMMPFYKVWGWIRGRELWEMVQKVRKDNPKDEKKIWTKVPLRDGEKPGRHSDRWYVKTHLLHQTRPVVPKDFTLPHMRQLEMINPIL